MRTSIDLDNALLAQAMQACGAATKRAAVEEALRITVQLKNQEKIRDLFGKVQWDGDLDAMRESRFPDWDRQVPLRREVSHQDGSDADLCIGLAQAGVDA